MRRRPPRATRTDTLFPYTTLFRSIELPDSVRKRMTYTGYLRRTLPKLRAHVVLEKISDPFLLVTVGGGGDGEAIIDWVLRAYEADRKLPHPALLVLGPFMNSDSPRSEARRVGKECVSTCISRGSP